MTAYTGTKTSTAKPVWERALGIACGIGILGVLCLGIGLTFGVGGMIQAGFGVNTVAAVVALFGGYDYFLYSRD